MLRAVGLSPIELTAVRTKRLKSAYKSLGDSIRAAIQRIDPIVCTARWSNSSCNLHELFAHGYLFRHGSSPIRRLIYVLVSLIFRVSSIG